MIWKVLQEPERLGGEVVGEFCMVLWELWTLRKNFLFKHIHQTPKELVKLVQTYGIWVYPNSCFWNAANRCSTEELQATLGWVLCGVSRWAI